MGQDIEWYVSRNHWHAQALQYDKASKQWVVYAVYKGEVVDFPASELSSVPTWLIAGNNAASVTMIKRTDHTYPAFEKMEKFLKMKLVSIKPESRTDHRHIEEVVSNYFVGPKSSMVNIDFLMKIPGRGKATATFGLNTLLHFPISQTLFSCNVAG